MKHYERFGGETRLLLASDDSSGGAGGRACAASDQRAGAASGQSANQRTNAGPAADERDVAPPVTAADPHQVIRARAAESGARLCRGRGRSVPLIIGAVRTPVNRWPGRVKPVRRALFSRTLTGVPAGAVSCTGTEPWLSRISPAARSASCGGCPDSRSGCYLRRVRVYSDKNHR